MFSLLSSLVSKPEYPMDKQRTLWGTLCALVGIGLNIFLFGIKLTAGLISGSVAITADAMNNLSDAGSSIVSMVGFKLAAHEADHEHPFGHGRMEYVAGLVISGLILLVAAELFKTSVNKIIHPEATEFSLLIVAILLISVLVKCYMFFYNSRVGKNINSSTLMAVAKDSISDTGATSLVLVAMLIEHFFGFAIDGYAGIIVSFFIFMTGVSAVKDTIDPLLGVMPDDDFIEELESFIMDFNQEQVIGVHDMMIHDYGPSRKIISFHAEVPAEGDILELHDTIDLLEQACNKRYNCLTTIHMDPVITKDERVTTLREAMETLVNEYDSDLNFHDFRVVFGQTHTNLIFDVVLPFGYSKTEDMVKSELLSLVHEKIGNQYFLAINFDRR